MVLGYSRLLCIDIVARQTALTVMLGLERAFAMFGGVPYEMLFDRNEGASSSPIIGPGGGRLLENPESRGLAAHWGFRIRAQCPARAQTKGKVEWPVRHFFAPAFFGWVIASQ